MSESSTPGTALLDLGGGAGTALSEAGVGMMATAESEVRAAVAMARAYPRDEMRAYAALAGACARPTFAESARYSYPRGKGKDRKEIDGLSIGFAREAFRVWGNLNTGFRIVAVERPEERPPHGRVLLRAFAWDLQTNAREEQEATFPFLIQRKGLGWVQPDERDFRELVSRHAAVAQRNCILHLLPSDMKEDLLARLRNAGSAKAAKDLQADRKGTVERTVAAFSGLGVSEEQLCALLGVAAIMKIDADGLAYLRGVYQGVRKGDISLASVFGGEDPSTGQSVAAAEAEAAMDQAAAQAQDADWEEEEEEEEEEEAKPEPKAAPKKRSKKAKAAAKPQGPEVRIVDGAWIGDLPGLDTLAAVLAMVEDTDAIIGMYNDDEREEAYPLYEERLVELGVELE